MGDSIVERKPKKNNRYLEASRLIVSILIFYGAVNFENPNESRLFLLIATFSIYILIGVIRELLITNVKVHDYSYIADIGLIFFLELNSKYLINYFFHIFYTIILIEISIKLRRRSSLILGVLTLLVSMVKYLYLLYYKYSFSNLGEGAFFLLVTILVLVISSFAQYYKDEKEKKDVLYKELLEAHKELKKYTEKVEELTAIEERNRIARDIHDTLGHNMTGIIMEIEMASHLIDTDENEAKKLLGDAAKSARDGLINIRRVLETLRADEKFARGIDSIKELAEDFSKKTQAEIELKVVGNIAKTSPTVNITLYRVVQEALTNAIRHGRATRIDITIKYEKNRIAFIISNDGEIPNDLTMGYGINGMKDRINNLKGNIEIKLDDSFIVEGSIPLEVNKGD